MTTAAANTAGCEHPQMSYWHSPDDEPFEWITIPQLIDQWAEKKPLEEAYVVRMNGRPRECLTFAQLKEKTEYLAAGLLQLGLSPGDYVMITGITCINWILADLACASIGVRTIRCRMSILTKEGLLQIANKNNVKALFYHPGEAGELQKHLNKCIPDAFQRQADRDILCKDIPSLQHVISLSTTSTEHDVTLLDELVSKQPSLDGMRAIKAKVQPDSMATVFMTSGSTGFPKAIPYTHFMLVNGLGRCGLVPNRLKDGDRFFSDRSLAWLGGTMHVSLVFGCCIVYVHPMTNAEDNDVDFCIQVFHDEKVTYGVILQYLISDISERFRLGKAEPFRLRFAITGGEVLLPDNIQKLGTFCEDIGVAYGCTECVSMASFTGKHDVEQYIQYAGKVENGTEIKIVDEHGDVVPLGQEGEIVVRSPFAFRGYLQSESKGMTIDANGWIKTDDAGCLEEGGLLKVFGRKSHVISRGITLTYPIVVERAIVQFTGVSAVAVIGVPDKRLGQNICACIIPEQGVSLSADDMLRCFDDLYQTDEGLGMTPAYFLFLPEFPTVNGKTDRTKLQSMAIETFGI